MIVDYIGIRDNMREAMKIYGGSRSRTLRRTIKSSIKKKIQLYSGFTLKYSCIFCIANNCCVFS